MSDFSFYFAMGWHHIMSWDALDHLLFILVLSAIYLLRSWKQVLILITAFTIGHSLTLGLSVYRIVTVNERLVELLIPFTITATALYNLLQKNFDKRSIRLNYFLALFFGLIHGLGFANSIRFMLAKDQQLVIPLLGFNLGLEAGQTVIVALILLVSYLLVENIQLKRHWWVKGISLSSFFIALKMIVERW